MKRNNFIMKHTLKVSCALAVALSVIAITECEAWTSRPRTAWASNEYFDASITPVLKFDINPLHGGFRAFRAFQLHIKNKKDRELAIVWQRTYYIEGGQTNGWFYFKKDAWSRVNDPKPDDIIFSLSNFSKEIYPSKLTETVCGPEGACRHERRGMPSGENGIYLTVKVPGATKVETIKVLLTR